MSALREKLIKNSTSKYTDTLLDSKIYNKKDLIHTDVPMINVGLSGSLNGGITPGFTMICGKSKHFKSGFMLLLAKSFLNKYPDGMILFYDSEFGTPHSYIRSFELPLDSIVHTPITDIEQLKFDIMQQLEGITRDDHVMIIIDSIGQLASKKEANDAIEANSKADMVRPKEMKSLFRLITPHLTIKDIPLVAINHVYQEMKLYGKQVVSGGTGVYLAADNIWIIGREQEKDNKDEVIGYDFIINVEKSRYIKEKTKIPISITYKGGINKWSGLFEQAINGGFVNKSKDGKSFSYSLVDNKTGEVSSEKYTEATIRNDKLVWEKLLKNKDFVKYIEDLYKIESGQIVED